ncbi:hypothetical protein TWF788_010369 [Orbilia oligospora]|uniref:Uncharacterized protein n=1 Tax=Orbilia oligospora TaxID=2813651 RepID=A0A6G1M156_ORBOL|nr:hypothetical protein TWF788_010369 [Orbilia oligospora]KAF3239878.1 hypothetical protein TWF192_009648 [Orbilia oligospora]
MQEDLPKIPKRDFLVPKNLNGGSLFDTSDDEDGVFTPGPGYSSAATSLGSIPGPNKIAPTTQPSRPATPKASILNPNAPRNNGETVVLAPVAAPPTPSSLIEQRERERELLRKRKREQTPVEDPVQIQIQTEHRDREGRLLERGFKSPSPSSLKPIIKRSPKRTRKSSIDATVRNETIREESSDTVEEVTTSATPAPKVKRRKANKFGLSAGSFGVLSSSVIAACVGYLTMKSFSNDSRTSDILANLCKLEAIQSFGDAVPFCSSPEIRAGKPRGPRYHKGDQSPPDYKRLMELQFSFEKILEDSVGGSRLAYDMKNSEMAVRDLTILVRVSGLACREQLSIHLEEFGDNARIASRSLSKFSSRVMGTIDSILALDEWAKKTLEDIRDSESGPKSFSSLVLWRDNDQIRRDVANTFTKTTEGMNGQLQRLVLEAQNVLTILDQLEEKLTTIHEIISREANHVKMEHDEVLSAIFTKLGANKQKIARSKEQVALLHNVNHYRKTALSHVSATVVELDRMSADLEQLRETVAAPSLMEGIVEVPIELHIRNIDQGILRLTAGRLKASTRKEEYTQAVLAGVDYSNMLINSQIADAASQQILHNVEV